MTRPDQRRREEEPNAPRATRPNPVIGLQRPPRAERPGTLGPRARSPRRRVAHHGLDRPRTRPAWPRPIRARTSPEERAWAVAADLRDARSAARAGVCEVLVTLATTLAIGFAWAAHAAADASRTLAAAQDGGGIGETRYAGPTSVAR